MSRPNPKTWGEASRRHARASQDIIAASRRPELTGDVRRYFGALAVEAIKALEDLEAEPPDAPYVGRRSATPCPTPGCAGMTWHDARTLWDRERASKSVPAPRCRTCTTASRLGPVLRVPMPEPIGAADMADLVDHRLEQIVELDRLIFRDPEDPELLAAHTVGHFARWAHLWQLYQREIVDALGVVEGPKRLQLAREAAGTAELVAPPDVPASDPDSDTPPREDPPAPTKVDRRFFAPAGSTREAEEPPDTTEQDPDPGDDGDPWVF
jgi:hypothetical protein